MVIFTPVTLDCVAFVFTGLPYPTTQGYVNLPILGGNARKCDSRERQEMQEGEESEQDENME
jgi:hypothetical protein